MLFPLAGFFGLFPGGRAWFVAHTSSELLHVSAHIALFAGLVWMLAFTFRWRPTLWRTVLIYVLAGVIGVAQEGLQVLAAGYAGFTSAEYFDLYVDLAGASIGLTLWTMAAILFSRPAQRAS